MASRRPSPGYTWRVRDSSGADLRVNAQGERAEWIPLKPGRFEVSVRMSYDNGTPADFTDDKEVTETRDVVVEPGKPTVSAL